MGKLEGVRAVLEPPEQKQVDVDRTRAVTRPGARHAPLRARPPCRARAAPGRAASVSTARHALGSRAGRAPRPGARYLHRRAGHDLHARPLERLGRGTERCQPVAHVRAQPEIPAHGLSRRGSSTSCSSSSGLNGLVRKRSAPASSAIALGRVAGRGREHHDRRFGRRPDRRAGAGTPRSRRGGMSMSRKTTSGVSRPATSTASSAVAASASSKPATSSSVVAMSLRMNGSSSTISTLGAWPASRAPRRRRRGCARAHRRRSRRARRPRPGRTGSRRMPRISSRASASDERWAVGPVAGDRVEGVGHREDAGCQRDPLTGQAVRVAAAVPALVVVAHDLRRAPRANSIPRTMS